MYVAKTQVRIRYSETDQMGILYHGNYVALYEIGRTTAFRELGLPYRDLEKQGIFMPVVGLQLKYMKPAYYEDLITIETTIEELPQYRLITKVVMYNEKQEMINRGEISLTFLEGEERKLTKAPAVLLDKLKLFFY